MTRWPDGYGKRILERVDSTLDEARRISAQISGPEWILALEQTKARGRQGRHWVNPVGNFAATLVLRPTEDPAKTALRSFVMAVALRDALVSATGAETCFDLKWPNDVLLNGGKVAGILLESSGLGQQIGYLAIGVGVNLAHAPDANLVEPRAVRPVCVAQETDAQLEPEQFLTSLAACYAKLENQFVTYGFEPIRSAWLSQAAKLGEVITARLPSEDIIGTFEDVDATGNLILRTAKGVRVIPAADVYY